MHWCSLGLGTAGSEEGHTYLCSARRSNRPTIAATQADKPILSNKRIETSKLATELSVSKGSVDNVADVKLAQGG
jgi:hypothetical protein